MDNDNKINEENLVLNEKNEIHQEVMLFLGDELENIHKSSQGQTYDIEKEYGKTKTHKSPFVGLILAGCFVVVIGISFMIHRIVSVKNAEIQVSLQKFDDLNLKGLLDTVSSAQSNYDNAVKTKATIEANMETKLKSASETYENDVFVLESLKLSKSQYNERLEEIKKQYNDSVTEIHKEFDESIAQSEKQIQEYKKQLAEFDTAKIEAAREQEKALNSERQLRKLETEKLTKMYEDRISEINNSMEELRIKNNEEMRRTVMEVTNKYQAEIDTLDPQLNDENANSIIQEVSMYDVDNFAGKKLFAESEIDSEDIENAVNAYQNFYDEYDYIDKTVASIPQKKSIPQYVKTSRSLVNAMGKTFYSTTMSLYDETVELNLEIDDLNDEIDGLNEEIEQREQKIEEKNQEIKKINADFEVERKNIENEHQNNLKKQQKEYEETFIYLMGLQKTNAIVSKVAEISVKHTVDMSNEEIENEVQKQYEQKIALFNNDSVSEEIDEVDYQEESAILSEEELKAEIRLSVPKTKDVFEKQKRIEIYVAPKARYLITQEGADAEIRLSKSLKGKIFAGEEEIFYFVVSPDKNGVIPEFDYQEIMQGMPVKILSK